MNNIKAHIIYRFKLLIVYIFCILSGIGSVICFTRSDELDGFYIWGWIFLVLFVYFLDGRIYFICSDRLNKIFKKESEELNKSYAKGLNNDTLQKWAQDYRKLVIENIRRHILIRKIFASLYPSAGISFDYSTIDMYWVLKDWQMVEEKLEPARRAKFGMINTGILICAIALDYKNGKLWEYNDFLKYNIFSKLHQFDKDTAYVPFLFAGIALAKKKKKQEALRIMEKANITLRNPCLEQFINYIKPNKVQGKIHVTFYWLSLDLYNLLDAKKPEDFFEDYCITPTLNCNI